MGAGFGALSGGVGSGLISKIKGGSFAKGLKETSLKESAKGAGIVTGTTAVINKAIGAYDPNKKNAHGFIQTVGPAVDDAAILGMALLKSRAK